MLPPKGVKVLLLENVSRRTADLLKEDGLDVEFHKDSMNHEELCRKIGDVDVLGIRSKTNVTADVIEKARKLKAIVCFCIGTNQVDIASASSRGIPVFNSPFMNGRSVMELVISEIVCLSRRLTDTNNLAHKGVWAKSSVGCHEIRGKTLGIIGYGHIGGEVATIANALGLNVVYHDIVEKPRNSNAKPVELNELLKVSDFVTIHVPGGPSVTNLIGEPQLKLMKDGSLLLNLSRGNVVDLDALSRHLKSGHLAGAAIDVYPKEPKSNGEKFECVLANLPNVILTPHIGGSTEEAQDAIGNECYGVIKSFLNLGSTTNSLNFPVYDLKELANGYARILNCHRNVPGVLGKINSKLSNFNIVMHKTDTRTRIAYLVVDLELEGKLEEFIKCADDIDKMEDSVWTRHIVF